MKKTFVLMALCALAVTLSAPLNSIRVIPPAPPHVLTAAEKERIQAVLSPLKGRSVWARPLSALSAQIQKAAPQKKAILKRSLLGSLQVSFEEPELMFLILRRSGELTPVFIDGALGPPVPFSDLTDRPIARGAALANDPRLRRQAARLLKSVSKEEGPLSAGAISEISYSAARESWILLLSPHHFSVELKAPLSPPHRKNINFVLSYLSEKEKRGLDIDARFEERIIARGAQDSGASSRPQAAPAEAP